MCGIAGIFNRTHHHTNEMLRSMIGQIRHRGPDGFGFYNDNHVGLAHARLSIIDLTPDGFQPIHNEDKSIWVTFNGEIFNYLELKEDLIGRGHKFYTNTDTEVIVHAYETYGIRCVDKFVGQFAFALYDKRSRQAYLVRDRMGIRPLHYTVDKYGTLNFASEIKSLFANSAITRKLDRLSLQESFAYWSCLQPHTNFEGIQQLPEGHYLRYDLDRGTFIVEKYWDHSYITKTHSEAEYKDIFKKTFYDAVKLRLRADVPVGAYLSGGLDSTTIVRAIMDTSNSPLHTFSIGFEDKQFDESHYQQEVADMYGIDHTTFYCSYQDVVDNFTDTIFHTEAPILRTAPVPMKILSKMVKDAGFSVVLTGEGADEALAGYDIFRETVLRRTMATEPNSPLIPHMLKALYPWRKDITKNSKVAKMFFGGEYPLDLNYYSHIPRWKTASSAHKFFRSPFNDFDLHNYAERSLFRPPASAHDKHHVRKAQYVEYHTLLSGYLISSQGDRVSAANAIEGRFPFLDHNLVEMCNAMPMDLKLKFMDEKYILKEVMKGKIPDSIVNRKKQPYMAPDGKSFFNTKNTLLDHLSKENIDNAGYFDYNKVSLLKKKFQNGHAKSFADNMAIVGILSTQILHDRFVDNFEIVKSPSKDEVFVDQTEG